MLRHCLLSRVLHGTYLIKSLLFLFLLITSNLWAGLSPSKEEQIKGIIANMESAYALVEGYRTETEVNVYRTGRPVETQRFLYTFKKPDHMRIDMEDPHSGMLLVFPDKDGKVLVKPGGKSGFLKFHLSPDSMFLRNSAGQRIDHTDLGLLIQNIVHSLTDRRRGEIRISGQDDRIVMEVLAEDHFLSGVRTLYQFSIDKTRWLPVAVKEFTADRILKRKVDFRNLTTSVDIPDNFFRIDGGNAEDGRPIR